MKLERIEDLKATQSDLDSIKAENSRLESEIKKQKLVANNYHEKARFYLFTWQNLPIFISSLGIMVLLIARVIF